MSTDGLKNDGRTIQSVEISLNIIEALQNQGKLTTTELADLLKHSKSTIHSHLQTLKLRHIIVRDPDGYRLSLRILDMANQVQGQIGNYDVIRDEVDKLADETNEIAQFGVEEHCMVSYLYKAQGNNSVETASSAGMQQPMYSTSLGKTILAFLPEDYASKIINEMEYEPKTPNTITGPDELSNELDQIHERGYGIDDEENIEGLRCISAPVKSDNTVLGAVSITGPSRRFTDEKLHEELSETVMRAANVIELNTKFS